TGKCSSGWRRSFWPEPSRLRRRVRRGLPWRRGGRSSANCRPSSTHLNDRGGATEDETPVAVAQRPGVAFPLDLAAVPLGLRASTQGVFEDWRARPRRHVLSTPPYFLSWTRSSKRRLVLIRR